MVDSNIREMQNSIEEKDIIELDKKKITGVLESKGYYRDGGIYIRKWEGEEDNDYFIAKINKTNTSFIGILNGKFQRDRNGINTYKNGDIYFGTYENDQRNKHGIYIWNPRQVSNRLLSECYYGFWRDNHKDNHGIYMWVDEELNNESFEKADIDAFVGEIDLDKYKRGSYMSKRGDQYYVYHGNIDLSGRKNDANAYFYSAQKDRLIKGKIVDDAFENGYVCFFTDEGNIQNIVYCTFNLDGTVDSITTPDKLNQKERKKIESDLTLFRAIILQKDYFGLLYAKYKELVAFIKNDMTDIDVLDDKEKFPKAMMLCVEYNNLTIYNDIETYLRDK